MQPTSPHPWQPTPPSRRKPWKLVAAITGGAVALCCGGIIAIGVFTDPPATNKAADLANTAQGQPLPPASGVSAPKGTPATASVAPSKTSRPTSAAPKPKPSPSRTSKKPAPKPTTEEPDEVYYKNCAAVRAAGADPIRRGDPGYGRHLDRDGDGVGCE